MTEDMNNRLQNVMNSSATGRPLLIWGIHSGLERERESDSFPNAYCVGLLPILFLERSHYLEHSTYGSNVFPL